MQTSPPNSIGSALGAYRKKLSRLNNGVSNQNWARLSQRGGFLSMFRQPENGFCATMRVFQKPTQGTQK
ncbi:hypothetical protein [Kingella sp. (in: b-proteobacteria)]|uniref:hypothetical protein n=1 Tax=Kingella sp. (in: b-proteobacteria) TaxID=2020713 RepID=UPI0026DCD1D0|nr:hypothetical protein [Kingella sp. (in: b-proteobacteria)]MDO4657701.1 hypothetical protein [Kingella sp. (in: b-proteobacteria)]